MPITLQKKNIRKDVYVYYNLYTGKIDSISYDNSLKFDNNVDIFKIEAKNEIHFRDL